MEGAVMDENEEAVVSPKERMFLIQVSKMTSMNGETLGVSCNVPMSASDDELQAATDRMTALVDRRLRQVNKQVLEDTGKSLSEFEDEERGIFREDSVDKKEIQ